MESEGGTHENAKRQALGLFNVPADVIDAITYFIAGKEVVLLWLCGNKRLMYTMSEMGGVKRLVLRTSGFQHLSRWPAIIPHFKRLEELTLDFGRTNLIGGNPDTVWRKWPKTIKKFTLGCREAETLWKEIYNIGILFPNLQELELDGWSGFKPEFLDTMPNTFHSLTLRAYRSSDALPLIDKLPPQMKALCLDACPGVHTDGLRKLPKTNFQTLFIPQSPLQSESLVLLPSTLTSLQVRIDDADIAWRHFPSTLLHLYFAGGWDASITVPAEDLPPKLITLELSYSTFVIDDVSRLPQTLTTLSIDHSKMPSEALEKLPSGLKKLKIIIQSTCFSGDSLIPFLPRSLLELSIQKRSPFYTQPPSTAQVQFTDESIALLPPHLLSLSLKGVNTISGRCFAHLPSGLTTLNLPSIPDVQDEHIALLPRFINHLCLDGCSDLTDACAKFLPRGMETLSLAKSKHFSFSCLPDLPRFIGSLNLGQTGATEKYKNDRYKTGRKFEQAKNVEN